MLDFVREPLLFQPRGDLIVTAKLSNQVRRIAIRRALDERCRRYEIEQSLRFSYRVARDRLPIDAVKRPSLPVFRNRRQCIAPRRIPLMLRDSASAEAHGVIFYLSSVNVILPLSSSTANITGMSF